MINGRSEKKNEFWLKIVPAELGFFIAKGTDMTWVAMQIF